MNKPSLRLVEEVQPNDNGLPSADRQAGNSQPSGGGGGSDDMERRVAILEEGMKEMKATLKDLRDGQHAAEKAAIMQAGEVNTKLAEISGKLNTASTVSDGLRRDIDKLPSKFDVTVIMITVIGGLGAAALLIKNGWPLLSRLFAP